MNVCDAGIDDRVSRRAPVVFAAVVLIGYGFLYSLIGAGLGYALFPQTAKGSLIERDGKVVGSSLVAQPFADARYFATRPSAGNFDPMSASGSNQSRSNPDLRKRINDAVTAVAAREGVAAGEVPSDLLTQSGGGMDPHLSPAAVRVQVSRVAKARRIPEADLLALVTEHTEGPQYGLFGQARVNVLALNLALDARGR